MLTISMILICVLAIMNCMSWKMFVMWNTLILCDDQLVHEYDYELYNSSYVGWCWETMELEPDSELDSGDAETHTGVAHTSVGRVDGSRQCE